MDRVKLLALVLLLLVTAGCVDFDELEREIERRNAPPPKRFQVDSEWTDEALPSTKREIGGLDDEHLIVPIPDDWYVPPRDRRWIARMQYTREDTYPTILIRGGENSDALTKGEPIQNLGKSNLEAYAEQVQQRLEEEREKKKLDVEDTPEVKGLRIGRFDAVTYTQPSHADGRRLDRLVIITIQRGRKYTIELRTLRGTLRLFRPVAYAVASRMKVM